MKQVDLKAYPKFWTEFLSVMSNSVRSGERLTAATCRQICNYEMRILVECRPSDPVGLVWMTEPTYTWFLIKWA